MVQPKWDKLVSGEIWRQAVIQVLFSLGLPFGPLMHYASARKNTSKVILSSFLLTLVNSLTSILACTTLVCYSGYIASKLDITVIAVMKVKLVTFTAYPGLLSTLTMANLWSIFFFGMMVLVGVDTIFGMLDFVIAYIWGWIPTIR
mmetsp:Transcript_3520/g.5291  ORF Transcript_3520/g.5291 Transcript_3520/m.5291 type:complete len:146 (-) Transcript_3520:614-1051(-)